MRTQLVGLAMGALVAGFLAAPAVVRADDDDAPEPIDSVQDLKDAGRIPFELVDINNDGRISQKEAMDAGNLLVGGFFFRADANGDGVVSKEEAQQARDALTRQKPLLRIVLEWATRQRSAQPGQPAQAQDVMQGIMSLIDANNDGQLQATELRQTVQTGVQGLYVQADTDRDGILVPSELNAAVTGMIPLRHLAASLDLSLTTALSSHAQNLAAAIRDHVAWTRSDSPSGRKRCVSFKLVTVTTTTNDPSRDYNFGYGGFMEGLFDVSGGALVARGKRAFSDRMRPDDRSQGWDRNRQDAEILTLRPDGTGQIQLVTWGGRIIPLRDLLSRRERFGTFITGVLRTDTGSAVVIIVLHKCEVE